MIAKPIIYLFCLLGFSQLNAQQSFLVRQTLSSNGSSQNLQTQNDYLLVQQSIGQLSVSGSSQSEHFILRQGFIQSDLGSSLELNLSELNISSYPNPFSDEVIIDFSAESLTAATVILRDLAGKEVIRITTDQTIDPKRLRLDTSLLSSGSYVLQIKSNQRIYTAKLIKQ